MKRCSTSLIIHFSHSAVSNTLVPHESWYARSPCPWPTTGAYPNSCTMSWWCHLTISSSVIPFSSCLQSFSTSGSFQMSQVFASGGWEMQIKSIMRYHLTLVRMAIIRKSTNNKCRRGCGDREHPGTVGGNVNWYSHCGKWYGDSLKN